MSIPPLVCSTPPPPDQCEEDKDPDDFDIPYNLSQDDDDEDDFGYGNYSPYNHFQSNCITETKVTVSKNKVDTSFHEAKQVDVIDNNLSGTKERGIEFGTNTTNENKQKTEEEINIEDLGLEVNEESTSSSEKEDDQSEEISNIEISEKVLEACDVAIEDKYTLSSPSSEENIVVMASSDNTVKPTRIDHCEEKLHDKPIDEPSLDLDVTSSESKSSLNYEISNEVCLKENSEPINDSNLEDDLEDFDDFQFASSERKTSDVIENCDNPWEANVANNDDNFGNFTANFEPIERQTLPVTMIVSTDINQNFGSSQAEEDDDFGDFDNFQSSTTLENEMVETADLESNQHLPVLNFQASDSDHHVMESITKVLTSVFQVEITEPEIEFQGRLESMLSETWRHLRETDVRQPYIMNWNNSLGQKTLLRALCIDSRNILFGPKWGYNMPKYAVNLSAAPLQPQKPLTLFSPSQNEPVAAEKPTTKAGAWADPFTADGQESCNTESENVVEVTSSDLDAFESAISTKADNKIYSSTIDVQPLRQISLPDTHIFTPTDSEIPTSKTVHYDSGPPILLQQTALESGNIGGSSTTEIANHCPKDNKDDDDYWEFQDFKSNSEKSSTTTASSVPQPRFSQDINVENVTSKPNVTYQTQVLQPIRMEPLMPTVNWPDPGEIKETFDDFSDFVSNSTWNDTSHEKMSTPQTENNISEINVLDNINTKHKNVENETDRPKLNSKEDFDDDFNTFQSALPSKHIRAEFNFDSASTNTSKSIPSQNANQIPDFNSAFPKMNYVKSEIISNINPVKTNEDLPPSEINSNTKELFSNKNTISNPITPSMLQPMPSSNLTTSQSKLNTSQILQPLSLESYSQINWPNPGIDLQDLSRFNPVETLQSLKNDLSIAGSSKVSSPAHNQKVAGNSQVADDDWGEFVSSKPKQQAPMSKKPSSFVDDDEWTDFVSSPSVKSQNGLNTISLNVYTNSNIQKTSNHKFPTKSNQLPLDIPTLNYITPKTSGHSSCNDRHFQNL